MVSLLGTLIPTPDPVLHRKKLGDGGDGEQFAEPVPRFGRWENTTSQIQNAEGRVVTLSGVVYLEAAADPHVGDRLAKAGADPDWRRVEKVDTATWFNGAVMHHEVYVS